MKSKLSAQETRIQGLTAGLQKVNAQIGGGVLGAKEIVSEQPAGKKGDTNISQPIEFEARIPLRNRRIIPIKFRFPDEDVTCLIALDFDR